MANHIFRIWQIPTDHPEFRQYAFTGWQETLKNSGSEDIPRDRYRMVWSEETDTWPDLEEIYERFNVDHPAGYTGRSLSISDLVEIESELYFCDEYRWRQVRWKEENDE